MELRAFLESCKFTKYEKEAITYLSRVESATANNIVKEAGIPQGKVYAVLAGLEERGILKVISTRPKEFYIKDLKESLREYLKREEAALKERREALARLHNEPRRLPRLKTATSIALFRGREEHENATIALRHAAQRELLQVAPLFIGSFTSNLSLREACKRGVAVRVIIKRVTRENARTVREALAAGAEIRQQPARELLSMTIRDEQEVLLSVEDYQHGEERVVLLCHNAPLLHALKSVFEREWRLARRVTRRGVGRK